MSATYVKEYSSFTSDIDLEAEVAGNRHATVIDRFEILSAGSGGLSAIVSGSTVTLTDLTAGDVDIAPSKILAGGTTVAKVRVWWRFAPRQ